MKRLIQWSRALGISGAAALGTLFAVGLPAFALPTEVISEKLSTVPVFTITDGNGAPLVASTATEEGGEVSVAGVFISRQDAQNFLDQVRSQESEISDQVQIELVSLGEIYELAEANSQKPDGVLFEYVPTRQQVDAAITLLKEDNPEITAFNGVPIFVARAGEGGGYLTIEQGERQIIPMFFSQEELQSLITGLEQSQPDLAATVEVQVVNLEGVIAKLEDSDNPQLNQVVLVPPADSINYIRSLQPAQPAPEGQPAQP